MPQDEGQGGPGPLGAAATAPIGLRSPPHLLPAPFPPVPLDTQNQWQCPGCWNPPSPTPPRTCSNALSPAPGEGVLGRHGEAGTEALQGLTRGPLPPRGAQTWMGPLVGSGAPVGARRVSGCGCLPPRPARVTVWPFSGDARGWAGERAGAQHEAQRLCPEGRGVSTAVVTHSGCPPPRTHALSRGRGPETSPLGEAGMPAGPAGGFPGFLSHNADRVPVAGLVP